MERKECVRMDKFGDNMKKLLLAGIGTVAVTAEKSKEILDEMVKKGELTVEQGKVLNQELKHNIKRTFGSNDSRAACTTKRTDSEDGDKANSQDKARNFGFRNKRRERIAREKRSG